GRESGGRRGAGGDPVEAGGEIEHVVHGDFVPEVAVRAEAVFDGALEEQTREVGGHAVAEGDAGDALELDPGRVGESEPDGLLVGEELEIHGIGVAGGDGDHHALKLTVKGFVREGIGGGKVLVHGRLQDTGKEFPCARLPSCSPPTTARLSPAPCKKNNKCASGRGWKYRAAHCGGTGRTCARRCRTRRRSAR